MFYSHEILSNSKYGVATIWLVATVGRNANKRVTRKAIQEVDVTRACETIIDPGAPLALRLQGNLLYGVARVFASQCTYVLSDAAKTQSDMMTFFRTIQTSETDPQAGKTKPSHITLQDDPAFDPMNALPGLDLLHADTGLMLGGNQDSALKTSQSRFTPLTITSQDSSADWKALGRFQLDLPRSSPSALNYALPLNMDRNSSSVIKQTPELINMGEFKPFGREEDDAFIGVDLDFDEDGNLLDFHDHNDQELPGSPRIRNDQSHDGQEHIVLGEGGEQVLYHTGEDGVFIMGEAPLPDAEAFNTDKKPNASDAGQQREQMSAASKKTHKSKKIAPDHAIILGRSVIAAWQRDYVDDMAQLRSESKRGKGAAAARAKKYAEDILFNNGLAEVGVALKTSPIVHPLANDFSGTALKAHVVGLDPSQVQVDQEQKKNRRRKSHEAFGNEPEEPRTRIRVEDQNTEHGRGLGDEDGQIVFGDDSMPEMGMAAGPGLGSNHSMTMPWSRPGSAIASSVRDPGSSQKPRVAVSPLVDRGSVIKTIERHSDATGGLEDYGPPGSQDFPLDVEGADSHISLNVPGIENKQLSGEGLDVASREFLGYAMHSADQVGVREQGRRWVDFEDLADPTQHGTTVAAHAFLHVLSLASQDIIKVRQEGASLTEPHGRIKVGINMGDDEELHSDVDELA